MSNVKIAFVGAPGTSKSTLVLKTIDLLEGNERYKVTNNLPDKILNSIADNNKDSFKDTGEFDMSCLYARRVELLSVDPEKCAVSDGWALNELANTMLKMKKLQDKINASSQILGTDGKPMMTSDHGNLLITQAAFQVIINQVAIEKDYWDFLYYVPILELEDGMIDEDDLLAKDKLNQKEIALAIESLIGQLQLNVVALPSVTEDAFRFLEAESEKWVK